VHSAQSCKKIVISPSLWIPWIWIPWFWTSAVTRDTMLAGVLAMAQCLCLSVTSRCSIEVVGRIELVFGVEASFHQSYTVFWGNSHIYKNKGTSLWNFFLNSRLRKFRNGISIERAINLRARERGRRSEHDKLDHRWSADNTSKLWCSTTVVSRRDPQALSTARVCHVGN